MSTSAAAFAAVPAPPHADARAVARWLLVVAAMVFVMVALGGTTRLTVSGLSIVEWQPIRGILPPFNAADWQELFDKYRLSPQFQKVFPTLTVDGFKDIFWLEYLHRLWGRVIGIAFLVPFLWFLVRRRIPPGYGGRLLFLFVLGGLQGVVGWLMVASGLVDRPAVSHYRLAIHLILAMVIYLALLWTAWGLLQPRGASRLGRADRGWAHLVYVLVALTVLIGAFVAGLGAGKIYNEFPTMGAGLVPPDYWLPELGWLNPVENSTAVQFQHRVLATLTLAAVLYLWWRIRGDGAQRSPARLLAAALCAQYALGIATLLVFGRAPPPMVESVVLGTLHQTGAMLVITALLWFAHRARRPGATPTR